MNHENHQQQIKEVTGGNSGHYATANRPEPTVDFSAVAEQSTPIDVASAPTPTLSDKDKEDIVDGAIQHLLLSFGVVNTMRYIAEAISDDPELLKVIQERFAVIHPQAPLNSFTLEVVKLAIHSSTELAELFELHDVFAKLENMLAKREAAFLRYEELQNKNRIGFLGVNMGLM